MATTGHLSRDELTLFLRGDLPTDRVTEGLAHLLQGCDGCSRMVRDELNRRRPAPPEAYSRTMLETLAFVLDREAPLALERIAAPGLVVRLMDLTWKQRTLLVRNDPRFRTWGLCERLLLESRSAVWKQHQDAVLDRARTALLVAEHLDPRKYGEPHLQDLLAEAYGTLANAHRLRSDFARARSCLDRAREHLARGTGDDLDGVRLGSLESSLLVSRGHFEDAVELLHRQRRRLVHYRESQLEAKILVQIGAAMAFYAPDQAVPVYEEALERIDPRLSPRLHLCARQGFIWSLNEAGRSHEALMQFQGARRLFRQFPDRWAQFFIQWTEARIAFRLGNLDEAEASLQVLWSQAFEMDLRLQTTIVTLDLIEVQLELGRCGEATRVACSVIDLFAVWKVHTPAVEAWTLLLEALRRRTASTALVGKVSRYLRRAWKNPEFEFRA